MILEISMTWKTYVLLNFELRIRIFFNVKLSNLSLTSSWPNITTRPFTVELVIENLYMSTVSAEPLKQKIPVSLYVSLTKEFVIDKSWMVTVLKCCLM